MFRTPHSRGALIEHPLVLSALVLWALNDHVLKARFANWWTGKLSDVCCVIVIPVLVGAACELVLRRNWQSRAHWMLVASALGVALVMVLINTWPPAGRAYSYGLAGMGWPFRALIAALSGAENPSFAPVRLWMDATDAPTALFALVPVWLSRARLGSSVVGGSVADASHPL